MCPLESAKVKLNDNCLGFIVKLVSNIKNGKLDGSYNIAVATTSLLEQIISDSKSVPAFELFGITYEVGRYLSSALPKELVAANIVRRVLRAIRDETKADINQETAGYSLQRLVLAAPPSRRKTLEPTEQDLRESLRDYIAELHTELESSTGSICSAAQEQVHANELILTYGASKLTERFLMTCISRKYKLIAAEGPTPKESHAMARRLSIAGVSVTVISNTSVFSVMSRVNKVVIGVRAVLAGGAVLGCAGMHTVTAAAKQYSVPVIALAPLYKLCPIYACDQHQFNSLGASQQVLPYESLESGVVHVYAPLYDFVPSDHITLFITNIGSSSPSYIYRLLSELYDSKDYGFFPES